MEINPCPAEATLILFRALSNVILKGSNLFYLCDSWRRYCFTGLHCSFYFSSAVLALIVSLILFYQSYNLTPIQMLFKMKTECQSYYCPSCLGILSAYRFDEITNGSQRKAGQCCPGLVRGTPYSAVGIHPPSFYYLKQVAGLPSPQTQTQHFPGPPSLPASPGGH